jgi:hypothetical protein
MARSRRKRKMQKCRGCWRHLIPYDEYVQHLRHPTHECTVVGYVHERNEQFRRYRELRSLPLTEED